MFSDIAALRSELVAKAPSDFVSHYLFEPVPFLFGGDLSKWIRWKTELADGIGVDPHDIVLTGSAAIGFSLNPFKNLRPFNDLSDVDCGVISPHHFDVAWRYLRELGPSRLSLPPASKRAIQLHKKTYVFSGTIATDYILTQLPYGSLWQGVLDKMGAMDPTTGRGVKIRVYKDYWSLRQYQANNIGSLRDQLLDVTPEGTPIAVED